MVVLFKVLLFLCAPCGALVRPLVFWVLPLFVPFVKSRRDFEARNAEDPFARPHGDVDVGACFHVSSEGEFEQVATLARRLLGRGGNVEILYTSPSVEAAVGRFCREAGGGIFALRLPLVSGGLEDWVRAETLVMVRYDFFPQLLSLAWKKQSILIHATLKNKRNGGLVEGIHRLFDFILPAGPGDEEVFEARGFGKSFCPGSTLGRSASVSV